MNLLIKNEADDAALEYTVLSIVISVIRVTVYSVPAIRPLNVVLLSSLSVFSITLKQRTEHCDTSFEKWHITINFG